MANIAIMDTGYLNITDSGDTAPVEAYSGAQINLKSVSVSFESKGNTDSTEIINTNTIPAIGFGSISAGKITIQGVLDRNDSTDMTYLPELYALLSTYGVKLLWYTSTTDGYRDLTDTLGNTYKDDIHKTDFFGGTATPHLHVRVTNFQITETSKSHMTYTLECVTTA